MLSNAYFLAKIRFDTAENEPAKKFQNFANFPPTAPQGGAAVGGSRRRAPRCGGHAERVAGGALGAAGPRAARPRMGYIKTLNTSKKSNLQH